MKSIAEKKLEETLKISEKRYEIVMRFSGITVFEYDLCAKKILTTDDDNRIFGMPKVFEDGVEEVVNSGIIAERSKDDLRNLYKRIDEGQPEAHVIIYANDVNGEERTVELQLISVFNESGAPVYAIGVRKDITETLLLKREKEYGHILASGRQLSYEANVSKDKLIYYNNDWLASIKLDSCKPYTQMIDYLCNMIIHPDYTQVMYMYLKAQAVFDAYVNDKKLIKFEYRALVNSVEYQWFEQTINIIKDELSDDIIIRCYISNIHDQKEKELKIIAEQKFYAQMLSKSVEVYEVNITRNKAVSGMEHWRTRFGITVSNNYTQMLQVLHDKVIHPDDRNAFFVLFLRENVLHVYASGQIELSCDYRILNTGGVYVWLRCTMHLFEDIQNADIRGFAYIEKIDSEKRKELELIYKAQHDSLTGLYNKATVEEKITAFFETAEAKLSNHAFFILDLDYFKSINDNFGHAFGDAVLSSLSAKLLTFFRDDDILGRIGGDEFVVLMKNIKNHKTAIAKAEEICAHLKESFIQNNIEFKISISIGIAFYNMHGNTYEKLYQLSDAALYHSKECGRTTHSVYSTDMHTKQTNINVIQQSFFTDTKKFAENILEYVFRILYESNDKRVAINSILELIGKHYNVSRAYIFEDSIDGEYTRNTFEWCNKGIIPQIMNSQCLVYRDLGNYRDFFNKEGVFYMPDINAVCPSLQKILELQGVKNMMQFAIIKNDTFIGFVGFDQCNSVQTPSKPEINDFRNVANILGVFLTEMRALEAAESVNRSSLSIINALDSYAYVCDADTYEVLFINENTFDLVPGVKVGEYCYKAFWNNDEPCADCPMKALLKGTDEKYVCEMYNTNLHIWVRASTSLVNWDGRKKACLVNSVDISNYKKR